MRIKLTRKWSASGLVTLRYDGAALHQRFCEWFYGCVRRALQPDLWSWNTPNYGTISPPLFLSLFLFISLSLVAMRTLRERDENWEALSISRFLWTRTNKNRERLEIRSTTHNTSRILKIFVRCKPLYEFSWDNSFIELLLLFARNIDTIQKRK